MPTKCALQIVGSAWLIALTTQLFISLSTAALRQLPLANDYDSDWEDEGIFQNGLSLTDTPPPEDIIKRTMPSEPLDITADLHPDSELSWELKYVADSESNRINKNSLHSVPRNLINVKKKRATNCGPEPPPQSARNLIGSTLKRADVATTHEDLREKLKNEIKDGRRQIKRNYPLLTPEIWSCHVNYTWNNLGSDYYPRHVRTARCGVTRCASGLYQCFPQFYKLRVLKRSGDVVAYEEPNNLLPPDLRNEWRLVNVEIVSSCNCGIHAK